MYEAANLRTEYSKTWTDGDIRYRTEITQAPQHYKDNYNDKHEQWKDIDLTWQGNMITKAPFIASYDAGSYTLSVYNKKTGDSVGILLYTIGDKSLTKVTPIVSYGKVTFLNVATDTDLELEVTPTVLRYKRIIKSDKAPESARFTVIQNGKAISDISKSTLGIDARYNYPTGTENKIPVYFTVDGTTLTESIKHTDIAKYPITVDPTLDTEGSNSDGSVVNVNANYVTCQGAANASTVRANTDATFYPQNSFIGTYYVERGFLYFDTSSLTAAATITDATLKVYQTAGSENNAGQNTLTIVEGVQGDPYDAADYGDHLAKTTSGGSCTWAARGVGAYTEIILNATGEGWINKTGTTLFCLRVSGDIAVSTPNNTNQWHISSQNNGTAAQHPRLVVNYTLPAPTTETLAATNIEETSATFNGNVTAIGGVSIIQRGFVYGTVSNATEPTENEIPPCSYTNNISEFNAWGLGTFNANIATLAEGTTYYFRAFAENDNPLYDYGDEDNLLTKPDEPTNFVCSTANATTIDLSWTKGTGADYTYIRHKTTGYPANRADGNLTYNGTMALYEHGGLVTGTTYYYRAWSWTSEGANDQYSDLYDECYCTATTASDISTIGCTGFTQKHAVLNGRIDALNATGDPITQYGFDYGLSVAYGSEVIADGSLSANDYFWLAPNDLIAGTVYHFRAKAYNGVAWGYGEDMVFSTEGSPTVYEYLNTGDDGNSAPCYASNTTAQIFTVGSLSHTITSVKLKVARVGTSPDDVNVSIYHATAADGDPTGGVLSTATLDGDVLSTVATWYEWDIPDINVEQNQFYAIVMAVPYGDVSNYMLWRWDAGGGVAGGEATHSSDAGVTWTSDAPADLLYEIWGEPAIDVEDAKIFQDYVSSGDWLITSRILNTYLPYYPNQDVGQYFQMQLIDGSTVKAATPLIDWDLQPIGICIGSTIADSIGWGSTEVKIRVSTYGSNSTSYSEYALQPTDWRAGSLSLLDNWIRFTGAELEDYYGDTYLVDSATKGRILNESGGVMFARGIPDLDKIRPNMFQVAMTSPTFTEQTWTNAGEREWSSQVGTYVAGQLGDFGTIFNVGGNIVIAMIVFAIYIIVGMVLFGQGNGIAAMVLGIPILAIGWWLGGIGIVAVGAIASIFFFFIVRALWTQGG